MYKSRQMSYPYLLTSTLTKTEEFPGAPREKNNWSRSRKNQLSKARLISILNNGAERRK